MECNCNHTDGIHEITCESNNEYEYYRCPSCGEGAPMFYFSNGVCKKCNDSTPRTKVVISIGDQKQTIMVTPEELHSLNALFNKN